MSVALTLDHRRQDTDDQPHARGQITNRRAYPHRAAFRGAAETHETRIALRDLIEARPTAGRAGTPETRDGRPDQGRVFARQFFVAESHGLHSANLDVLDNAKIGRAQYREKRG